MIKMGVGKDDRANRTGIDWKPLPVELALLTLSLEDAAIDQQPSAVMLEEMPGAGDRPRCA